MALTRKMLAAMGIEEDKIEQIIESHTETVDGLKQKVADAEEKAKGIPDLEKKIKELEDAQPDKDWEAEYNALNTRYEEYKQDVAKRDAEREKARLYRAMLRELGIDEKRLDAIMKVTDLSDVEVEDGAIKEREKVAEAAKKEWEAFVPTIQKKGAAVADPPASSPTTGADPEIVKRLKERQERLYGKAEEKE